VTPETFNRFHVRAIGRSQTTITDAQTSSMRLKQKRAYDTKIVYHQHTRPVDILSPQFLQEVDELRAFLGFSRSPGDLITHPVVSTKDVPFCLFQAGVAECSLMSDLHPAARNGGSRLSVVRPQRIAGMS
jgi:hypothetical protein